MASPNVDPTEDHNRQNLKIMVLGKTGSGKSTFINSVFGKRISTGRRGIRQQDHPTLEVHHTEINGVHLSFYDTRGIGISPEETQTLIEDIKVKSSSLDLDLFLICIKLTERLMRGTLDAIRDIREVYGNFFLQRCIIVCTFANIYEIDAKRYKPNISRQELAREIEEELGYLSNKIQNTWDDVPAEAFSEIPFIAVGWRNTDDSSGEEELKLSTSDNWIHGFFDECSRRCPEKHLEPLKRVAVECVPRKDEVEPWKVKVKYAAVIIACGFLGGAICMLFFPRAASALRQKVGSTLSWVVGIYN